MPGNGFHVVQRLKEQQQIAAGKSALLQKLETEIRLYERHKENAAFITLHESDVKQRLYGEDRERYYQFKDFTLAEIADAFYAETKKGYSHD